MTEFKIKSLDIHTIRIFKKANRGDRLDKLTAKNDAIKRYLYSATADGRIKGFYKVTEPDERGYKEFRAFHRSPKQPDAIQCSVGWYHNGELLPTYDTQYTSIDEFLSGYKAEMGAGIYRIID